MNRETTRARALLDESMGWVVCAVALACTGWGCSNETCNEPWEISEQQLRDRYARELQGKTLRYTVQDVDTLDSARVEIALEGLESSAFVQVLGDEVGSEQECLRYETTIQLIAAGTIEIVNTRDRESVVSGISTVFEILAVGDDTTQAYTMNAVGILGREEASASLYGRELTFASNQWTSASVAFGVGSARRLVDGRAQVTLSETPAQDE